MRAQSPPANAAVEADADAWSRYWARGALHSCPHAFAGNYDGEIAALWTDFAATLAAGARLLDIGTGNGAVAFLARDAARGLGRSIEVEAIDAADIDPRRAAAAHGLSADAIVFRARTPCERTGFPSAWFDAITGQYALEYSRTDETIVELARVLKAGGRGLFVIHHAASRALDTTRAELDCFRFLKHEAPVVLEARRCIRDLTGRSRAGGSSAHGDMRVRLRALQRMLSRVVARAKHRPQAQFLEAIAVQVAAAMREAGASNPRAAMHRLDVLGAEMTAHERRLGAMLRAAHSADDIERLAAAFEQAGFLAQPPTSLAVRDGELIGWVLRVALRR